MGGPDLSDEALMTRAARGDKKAFEAIYDRYAGRIHHYFLRMLYQDEEKAKDQTQELFLKLIRHGKSYDGKRPLKPWIFSLANNMCKNIYRHNEVKRNAQIELKSLSIAEMKEEEIDESALRRALNEEIHKLDQAGKSILILRFKMKMSIKEIAAVTDIPEGSVKSKIFYTLKKLSKTLEPYNPRP